MRVQPPVTFSTVKAHTYDTEINFGFINIYK